MPKNITDRINTIQSQINSQIKINQQVEQQIRRAKSPHTREQYIQDYTERYLSIQHSISLINKLKSSLN